MEKDISKILILLSTIMATGLIILYSASYIAAYKYPFPSPDYYFKRQLSAILIGTLLMIFTSFFNYKKHESYTGIYYVLTILALLSVFFSHGVMGSHRWISLGPFSFQSSEFAKIFLIIYLSSYVSRQEEGRMRTFVGGVFEPLVKLSPIYLLVFLEPDLSTTTLLIVLTLFILYVMGARLYHILSIFGLGGLLVWGAYVGGFLHSYQKERLSSFLSLLTTGHTNYQLSMALSAISHGGIIGNGPAGGVYKFYMPVQFSDFIFATFGEEFGLLGISLLLLLYYLLIREIIHVALKIEDDMFARTYITGFGLLVAFQILLNAGVSLGVLPVTGVTLPFVSYGGSSIVSLMGGMGVIINIAYSAEREG
ncbi:FtsW/RodA/SpoVE family cell cycle protein [Mesoaciditoga lauensis]|uniref:FtsW/RodA/SpoVE family cell cycle protein n=1 Tax=Mesoaciditoga lauensis TaxID=1495039 RepID=UPI00056B0CF0|nr:FtsW/RodA/SpoVE family cell cycle protein [Mesoaciditoga lauensis]